MVSETWKNTSALTLVDSVFQEQIAHYSANPFAFVDDIKERLKDNFQSFPSMNADPLLPAQWVRVRCMVQDVKEDDYLPTVLKFGNGDDQIVRSNFLRELILEGGNQAELATEGGPMRLRRYTMVRIPGATPWWMDEWNGGECTPPEEKRVHEEGDAKLWKNFVAKIATNDELQPNSMWDMHGYLSVSPSDENNQSDLLQLHVISYEPIETSRNNNAEMNIEIYNKMRSSLTDALKDETTANFVLLNLVSTTYARPGGMPICSLPLNICGVTDSAPIVNLFKQLLPRVVHLELTPALLCDSLFASAKNYDTDTLTQGLLQLAPGTTVILDETQLPEGNFPVSEVAQKNLRTLERVLVTQEIEYDYKFYPIVLNVDYPLVILSKQGSRLFKVPFRVAVQTELPLSVLGSTEELSLMRAFIQKRKLSIKDLNVSEETSKAIQDSFVELAATLDSKTEDKQETLHQILILSRLVATLECKSSLDIDSWNTSRAWDKARNENLVKFVKNITQ